MDVNDRLYFGEDSFFCFNTDTIMQQYNLFNWYIQWRNRKYELEKYSC